MERNVLPIRYIVRYENDDEPIHTIETPYCNDPTCPCYSEAETIKSLAQRLPLLRRLRLVKREEGEKQS